MSDIEPSAIPLEALVDSANGDVDAATGRILRAARREFELVGIRRSNMIDIARAAGVSRATLYRRFQDRDALVEAVFAREIVVSLARVEAQVARSNDAAEAIVGLTVAGLRALRELRILQRVLQTEPAEVFRWLVSTDNAALAMTRTFICRLLEPLQASGRLHRSELSEPAEMLARMAMSLVLAPEGVMPAEMLARMAMSLVLAPEGVMPADDDAHVAAFVRRYLVPMFTAGASATCEA